MKTVILSSKSSHQDLLTYGPELVEDLKKISETKMYDQFRPDFSDVPELFDEDEKLVLFNHFAIPGGFTTFSKYLPEFKNVKFILSPYSRYEGLDLELLKARGIRYRNNAGANAKSVAQYAITAMFMLLSKFPVFTQQNSRPDGSVLGEEFYLKTAGIIGMGKVGQELCQILNKLGIPVTYYNRSSAEVDAKLVSFDEVFKQDLIFVTIAGNEETKKTLEPFPTLLQPQNYVIDISAVDWLYDKKKVVELLDQDKIRGYALEILNPDNFKLESKKNFIATPHIAWCTIDAEKRTVVNYLNYALNILRGQSDKVDFIV